MAMIRAVIRNGTIVPLEPVPPQWIDGQELRVDESEGVPANPKDGDEWLREMDAVTAELNDPKEWEQIEATLAEADQQAKNLVRRAMELSVVA
jgi:hypothetical protein